ncbi:MAG: Uncharacterized protein AWU57_322 [Marinobacter sp. T13-3]|nr:MAG: Uncharacterized protein AWU57_322 [Marinobacter sp. T13-3]
MSDKPKTLSIGNRRRPAKRPQPRFRHPGNSTLTPEAYAPSIKDDLEAVLAGVSEDDHRPPVRLKNNGHPDYATDERIILIRRNPYPHPDEYQPAHTEASERALKQWVNAGIGDQFPAEHRLFAEKDLVRTINDNIRLKHKESKRAWNKYSAHNLKFQEETVHEFSPGEPEYERGRWQVKHLEQDADLQHEISGYDRLATLTHALTDGYIVTAEGRQFARSAQLLALVDTLPVEQVGWLPPDVCPELSVSINGMELPMPHVMTQIKSAKVDWDIAESAETLFLWKRIFWTLDALIDDGFLA